MAFEIPYLIMLLAFPMFGFPLVFALGKRDLAAKLIAFVVSIPPLIISVYLLLAIYWEPGNTSYRFVESHVWIEHLGISFILGIDGLSVTMVFLSTLLTTLGIIFSWDVEHRVREFMALLLFMEMCMLGVFLSLDYFLFFIFWELGLLPMYFLIAVWGGPNKKYASIKFFLYTQAGSLLVMLGIFALYFEAGPIVDGHNTFSMIELAKHTEYSQSFQTVIFFAFLIGFGVKMPMVPFHTWLPDAHVQAPTAGSVILAGVLLKMGSYGLIRVALQTLPQGAESLVWVMFVLASISIIYGALLCIAQEDLKSLIAYSSISHMGIVLLGIACLNSVGLSGAIYMMFAHGLVSPLLFMLAGVLQHKAGTRDISKLGGLAKKVPVFASLLVAGSMASLGFPGLVSFIAEVTVFVATYEAFQFYIMIPILGVVITAGYYTWALQRTIFGPMTDKIDTSHLRDLDWYESIPLGVLMLFTVIFGILPILLMTIFTPWSTALISILGV
jgi:NADH-quinone oxidoreductase subunit M